MRDSATDPPLIVGWYGRALAIASEYNMHVGGRILADLAGVLESMGEAAFVEAWGEAFDGEEPPLEAIRKAGEAIGEGEEE